VWQYKKLVCGKRRAAVPGGEMMCGKKRIGEELLYDSGKNYCWQDEELLMCGNVKSCCVLMSRLAVCEVEEMQYSCEKLLCDKIL
jgi:hypothetical protein